MKLNCYSYRLPFHNSFKSSNTVYHHREGFVLCLSGSGFRCYGEAAPLPGFSLESLQYTETQIATYIDKWLEILETDQPVRELRTYYPAEETSTALQFGLDSLAYQLQAQKEDQSLLSFLFGDSVSKVAVNGLLSLLDNTDPVSFVERLTARGFRTVKCKIGADLDREREQLTQIRNQFPNLRIRLDANRAWTLNEAVSSLGALESLGIEYCEEPLRHPTPEKYRKLNRQISLPLALDESINKNQDWESLLPYCSVLIIKPMVIGSFAELFTIRQQAQKFDCSLVFTSSLESSIGRTITAVLASGLGSPGLAHGLNTGSLLARDITLNQPKITSGSIHLDDLDTIAVDHTYLETIAINIISSR